ncbi:MAG TPA: site-specific DNA-methyltransferase [Candidatus Limnocylindria bacterium]|nr:site-specific DNA-methyltransferase [Candidatus Limnocylindria bacterium]
MEQTRHAGDQRVNIPTAELEKFAEQDESQPKKLLYPRDPSLDPQLVWKGKDEQDQQPLEVPSVPIYIQEHISPKALIEDLRATSSAGREQQLDLFGDFNGMEFDERVEFYQHPMKWSNRMILGDSLLVMTSLAEKEGLKGQVQMIYVDPPYGIKFGSNWQVRTDRRDVKDGKLDDATRQPEQIKAFRDTWELGIHSYLSYLRDRFVVARDLLADSGSIFVQIGDENVHVVRAVLDEVFGSDQVVGQIAFAKTAPLGAARLPSNYDYILWYARNRDVVKFRPLFLQREERTVGGTYSWMELEDGSDVRITRELLAKEPVGRRFRAADISGPGGSPSEIVPINFRGKEFRPSPGRHWKTHIEGMQRLIAANRVVSQGKTLGYKRFEDDFPMMQLANVWTDTIVGTFSERWYAVQTSPLTIARCILMSTDPGDLVLDPTSGGGTTAAAAEEWGRRWIAIDTSRVAMAIARSRMMGARYPYYRLADNGTNPNIRMGFEYQRIPRVTLGSIANNPDIRDGMTRDEIDAAIARHAETEILYDRPHIDPKVVRVAGPFTVESLSPHRVLGDGPEDINGNGSVPVVDSARFVDMVLDNLRKAGVQNQVKQQRLTFETLDRFPGRAIQADGKYDEGGATRRAAVAIGPEYGTVGKELVREAAKEAADWADLLIVCGYAFDARAEEMTALGRLPVVYARMNADLLLGDQLKKTGTGNLFTVFGQPDVEIRTLDDGQLQVDIRGIDVYDPTAGEIRSDAPDMIASWFIDTDYNGESFFVRHAYFCGGDRPYERLSKTLKADIDPEAWESLYSATSRPFPRPESGKIAVKVINHYGDEILKVYEV